MAAAQAAAGASATGAAAAKLEAVRKPTLSNNSQARGKFTVILEESVATKQLTPTRLSRIETAVVELSVTEGLIQQSTGFLRKTNWLSFKIKIPIIQSEVRRKDEDFDLLQDYLVKTYPNVIVPTTKPFKGTKYNQ